MCYQGHTCLISTNTVFHFGSAEILAPNGSREVMSIFLDFPDVIASTVHLFIYRLDTGIYANPGCYSMEDQTTHDILVSLVH